MRSRGRSAERVWNFDVDRKRRYRFAAIHLDLDLIGVEGDVAADERENFLAQNAAFKLEAERSLLPWKDGTDGAYTALLKRAE